MRDLLIDVLVAFNWFVLVYFLALNSIHLLTIIVAGGHTIRSLVRPGDDTHRDIFANPMTPPVSIIMGAFNEEPCIVDSVHSALGLRYPQFEVVVVDDGSTDGTFERLASTFDLVEDTPILGDRLPTVGPVRSVHVPRSGDPLIVIRKENAGRRADALNVGLNAARYPLVCCIDADSILDADALLRVARPMVEDPLVVATGGTVRAVNGSQVRRGHLVKILQPHQWLVRAQIVEYLRSFLLGRTTWSKFQGLVIISGAFGLYRRDLLIELGGFDLRSLGEDADVVVSLHRHLRDRGQEYRMVSVPEPVCWTEVPSTLSQLGRQRTRWSHGLGQVLWKHRSMLGNPKYGRVGLFALPYYLVFELLGPVVELVGMVAVVVGLALGIVSLELAALVLMVSVVYGAVVSVAALLVEEAAFHKYRRWRDLAVALAAVAFESLGFRQLHAWWRVRGLVRAACRHEPGWNHLTRVGFTPEEARQ